MSSQEPLDPTEGTPSTESGGSSAEPDSDQTPTFARALANKWRQLNFNQKVLRSTLLSTAIVVAFVYLIPSKSPYLNVKAETETLVYRVARQDLAGIMLVGASITTQSVCQDFDSDLSDFVGLIRPVAGTEVRYRWSAERLSITIRSSANTHTQVSATASKTDESTESVARLENAEGAVCNLREGSRVSIPRGKGPVIPLPIAGPLEIGVPFGVPLTPRRGATWHTGILYGASVQVYGRAFISGKLYPVSDAPIDIPTGSSLISPSFALGEHVDGSGDTSKESGWYGVAIPGERGFHVSATVDTADLRFYRAGGFTQSEEFDVSFLIELVRDPVLSKLILCLGVFTLILPIAINYFSITRPDS